MREEGELLNTNQPVQLQPAGGAIAVAKLSPEKGLVADSPGCGGGGYGQSGW